ncbi:FecR domain-containing protein [bacterium]|nr:FecR domain-containing protein [bacterium]
MSRGNTESNDTRRARINAEAADWVIKQSYDFSPEDQDAFFEWLAADPDHADAYQQRQETWKQLDILADWRPEHSLKTNRDLLDGDKVKKPSQSKFPAWVFATAAVIALGCLLGITVLSDAFSEPTKLSSGEFALGYERHVLEDGSVVELNLGTQATVDFSKDRRLISLQSGEAYFTIAKDPQRPFTVMANGVSVQAVGTIFNVQIRDDSVGVLVTEGRVRVQPEDYDQSLAQDASETAFVQELSAGQQTVFEIGTDQCCLEVSTLSDLELEHELTWLKQVIYFDAAPLSDIVFEFNRRNYRKIVIEDPTIEDTELTVTIRPQNIDDFVELLPAISDIQAERMGESVIILRSK